MTSPVPAGPTPAHTLVSCRGTLGTPGASAEIWSNNFRIKTAASMVPVGGAGASGFRTAVVTALRNFYTNANMQFGNWVRLPEVRFSDIGDNGHQTGPTFVQTIDPVIVGAASNPVLPWQCSMVVTLVADGRGKGHKGRWFLPPQTLSPGASDGLIGDGPVGIMLPPVKALITALNTAAGAPTPGGGDFGGVVIVGRTGAAGTMLQVNEVRIGHVVDTHRSRRNQLVETYLATRI